MICVLNHLKIILLAFVCLMCEKKMEQLRQRYMFLKIKQAILLKRFKRMPSLLME